MADVGEDVGLFEILLILGAVGVGGYLLWKAAGSYLTSAKCLVNVGAIPGVTGATQAQTQAAAKAAACAPAGGTVIWSCGSDYDYIKPCGNILQVRHSFFGQLFGTPNTSTTIPASDYKWPSGGTRNPQFACCFTCTSVSPAAASGKPACCGGKSQPVSSIWGVCGSC